jgi:hypothetical protein
MGEETERQERLEMNVNALVEFHDTLKYGLTGQSIFLTFMYEKLCKRELVDLFRT